MNRICTDWLWNHETFQEWNKSNGTKSTAIDAWLTVKDKPFTGKSVLMKEVVISKLKDAHTITLHHFFHGGKKSERSAVTFLRNILGQLLQQVQVRPWSEVRDWGQKIDANKDPDLSSVELLEELIKRVISENKGTLVSEKDIRIFVDGVDECSDAQDDDPPKPETADDGPLWVLQFLQGLLKHTTSAGLDTRVCVSRRPVPEYHTLEPPTKTITLEKYTSVEVKKFVHAKLEAIEDVYERSRIFRRLEEKWSDDFRWATIVTSKILKHRNNIESAERIAAEVPLSHENLYERALSSLKASPHKNKDLLKLLQLGLAAWRPLTVEEFRQALAYSVDDPDFESMSEWEGSSVGLLPGTPFEKFIQRESHGFLEITAQQNPSVGLARSNSFEEHLDGCSRVSFTHYTVEPFLRSKAGLGEIADKESWLENECHLLLLKICLAILHRCGMEHEADKEKGIQLRDYACEFWLRHAQKCRTLPKDFELPQFLLQNCRRTKTKRLLKEQIKLLNRSGALECLLFEWQDDDEPIMMAVLLATMGCTELLQRHLEGCKPCKKMLDPIVDDKMPLEDSSSLTQYRAALQNAIMGSWTDTALFLLEQYPLGDINTLFDQRTLLYHASYFACETLDLAESNKRMKCVSFLLSRGADPTVQSPFWWEYPLHVAIHNDNKNLMKSLFQNATPAQAEAMFKVRRRRKGWTALHFAVTHDRRAGRPQILENLLEFAPKNVGLLDMRDEDGKTPLDLAKQAGADSKKLAEHLEDFKMEEEEDE